MKAPAVESGKSTRYQMADIARLAGVSTATVSRALNNSPLINEETRRRIRELANSLNYTINVSAKNLRLGANNTIAVVVPKDARNAQPISDPFFLGLLGSLADALTERGYEMLVTRVDADHLMEAGDLYTSGRAAGIILIGQWKHHDHINQLAANRIPLAVWGGHLSGSLYATVGGDNERGGYLATRHLLDKGCRRILFLGDVSLPEVALRYEGYRHALKEAGIRASADLKRAVPFAEAAAREAVPKALDKAGDFDGVFACSDLLAMTTILCLSERGLDVPKRVRVVGYDDIASASYFSPPLTSIRQPVAEAGTALVNALENSMAGQFGSSTVLPAALVKRRSA